MFNFNNFFNKKTIKPEDIKKNEQLPKDIQKLSKASSEGKGISLRSMNPFYHSSEHQEEEQRLNENDLKGHLRKYVPIEDISSGDEWERYGEKSDNPEDEEEKEKYESVLTSDSPLEDHEEAFLNSLKEETENSIEVNEKLIEEERQKLFSQYVKDEENKNGFTKLENIKKDFIPEHKEEKINIKEERKTRTSMSPIKTVSSEDDVRIGKKPRSHPRNKKTVSDSQKQKMHREKIAEFLDSKEGQNRIF